MPACSLGRICLQAVLNKLLVEQMKARFVGVLIFVVGFGLFGTRTWVTYCESNCLGLLLLPLQGGSVWCVWAA